MRIFRNGSQFFIIMVIVVIGIVVFAPQALSSFSRAQRRAVGWYKEPRLIEYSLERLDSIEVKTTSLNISIMVSDKATETTVSYYTNWDGHVTDNRSSSLKIEENWKQNWLYVFLPKLDHLANREDYISLEITVPRGTDLTRLRATTKSGKIEISGIRADTVNLNATNQNIMVTDCAFEDTNITNTSGSTTIKNSSLGDRGKISHTSGNINLTNSSVGDNFRIKGSCTLTRCSLGDDVKIENANGNVTIDQTVFDGLTISSTSGTITVSDISGFDLCNFNLRATSGTIRVNGENQGTVYNVKPNRWQAWLKITATSGSIVID